MILKVVNKDPDKDTEILCNSLRNWIKYYLIESPDHQCFVPLKNVLYSTEYSQDEADLFVSEKHIVCPMYSDKLDFSCLDDDRVIVFVYDPFSPSSYKPDQRLFVNTEVPTTLMDEFYEVVEYLND